MMEASFLDGAGFTASSLRALIVGAIILFATLWFFWVLQGNYKMFVKGDIDQMELIMNAGMALFVLVLIIVLIAI